MEDILNNLATVFSIWMDSFCKGGIVPMSPISNMLVCALLFPGMVARGGETGSGPLRSVSPQIYRDIPTEHGDATRMFQGIPGIERSGGGRLWATWYGGGVTEDRHNYILVSTSGDDGSSWTLSMSIDPDGEGPIRAFDPCLWGDPEGRLWLFWAQADTDRRGPEQKSWSQAGGEYAETWAMVTSDPDSARPIWSEPRRVFGGIMMNKPTVVSGGRWLMPVAWWYREVSACVVETRDKGVSWSALGGASVPDREDRNCDEHMIVERGDGSLWMLIRTRQETIGESFSTDGGKSWTAAAASGIAHPTSRFFIRRLVSGNLLLVKHGPIGERTGRSRLMAFLSDDEGKSWRGGLLLDSRNGVSYPDGTQSSEGLIYIIYDFDRLGEKIIHMAAFREEDVLAGKGVSGAARMQVVVNRARGLNPRIAEKDAMKAIVFASNADGAALATGRGAVLEALGGKAQPLRAGEAIFSDRRYRVKSFPSALEGKRYIQGSIEGVRAVCRTGGLVYVVTPLPTRNRDSVSAALAEKGFVKTNLPEFLLFDEAGGAGNVCSTYQKRMEAGERLEFGKWGVAIF